MCLGREWVLCRMYRGRFPVRKWKCEFKLSGKEEPGGMVWSSLWTWSGMKYLWRITLVVPAQVSHCLWLVRDYLVSATNSSQLYTDCAGLEGAWKRACCYPKMAISSQPGVAPQRTQDILRPAADAGSHKAQPPIEPSVMCEVGEAGSQGVTS